MVRPGDILLVFGGTALDAAIDCVTDSPFSHAALAVNQQQVIEARPLSDICQRPLKTYNGCSLVLRVPGITPEQQAKVIQYAEAQLGKPYDYVAIIEEFMRYGFGISLKKVTKPPDKYICSTLVTASYLNAGIRITDQPIAAPGDLFISKKLTVVGRLGVDL